MNRKANGVIAGMTGFFAGALAVHLVTWQPWAKACLGAGVCAVVSGILLYIQQKRMVKQCEGSDRRGSGEAS